MMTQTWKIAGLILAVGGPVAFAQGPAPAAAPAAGEAAVEQPAPRRGGGGAGMGMGAGFARQTPEQMLAEYDKPDGELDLDELVAMYEARAAARRGAGGAGPGMGAGGPGGAGPGMGAGGPGGAGPGMGAGGPGGAAMDPEAMAERNRAQAQRMIDQFDADGNGKLNMEELTASQARGGRNRGAAPGGAGAGGGFGGGGGFV